MTKGRDKKNKKAEKPVIEQRDYSAVRVLVAVASEKMINTEMAMCLAAMSNHNTSVRLRMALNNHSGDELSHVRNRQVMEAERLKATHILFVNTDMHFKPWTCQRLLDAMLDGDESIVGVSYPKVKAPFVMDAKDVDGEVFNIEMDDARGLVEVSELGTGLVLVDMNVFKDVSFPWFNPHYAKGKDGKPDPLEFVSGDTDFYKRAREKGNLVMCDVPLSRDTQRIGDIKFDFTSKDFFADAIELRRQKAEEIINESLKPKEAANG
jgi:hypothetical protein